ncbi:hypothetical protein A3D70_00565 [Candidatus Adlerbacteria bacterium RIFCSPHIGHO2_02_FULL_54_18]|uniref:Transposase IS200-like domain-containing protein n=2 Tax=Candidatus Adleribacteriota TaxID=1752736 RepID=A0A1F4Y1F6_9BACT|nr:MAG: hypothetical protein A2949_02825 [Candidatus Adlerbacteria bacterium RIFCSPLOWO2_01_FULL_54_21b]OGC87772.1 MAG: hypothetical protein A3D70_00565 [Candidatus Adlerbacteria bacterium RIFCSPHIGHO2_02_FULL_54_18]
MQRKVIFAEKEFYHLYNRGVEKRKIFLDEKDRRRFLRLLYVANGTASFVYRDIQELPFVGIDRGEPLVAIGAYVLMPNHFHILVKEIRPGGISKFMEKLLTGYSSYFNKKYGRTGRLFENSFQARHLDRDEYLKYTFSYIHLNPIKLIEPKWREWGIKNKSNACDYLDSYPFSSYMDYLEREREEKLILSRKQFPKYFLTPKSFKLLTTEWLAYKEHFT